MNRLVLFSIIVLWSACQPNTTATYTKLSGKTMGTTYNVTYDSPTNYQQAIDSLLVEINDQVSTYIPTSSISIFNQNEELVLTDDAPKHFEINYFTAKDIFETTEGYFDPTVMPVVNYWGFGYTEKRAVTQVDSAKVDSLRQLIGFTKTWMETPKEGEVKYFYKKTDPAVQLDFSAIAKGYAVDAVGYLLASKGVENYLVEIGGETVARGKNQDGEWWRIGIQTPKEESAEMNFSAIVSLKNQAIATSGNYENYFEVDGVKYAHTINPKTGFPEKNTLLSVTVFAKDCMTADGYATGFMTMGLEKAKAIADTKKNLMAYFIYSDDEGNRKVAYTDGVEDMLLK